MKNIIITGASGGIGRETALQLAKDPDNRLFLISRDSAKLNALLNGINDYHDRVFTYAFDLISGDYALMAETIMKHLGTVDVLINNAGVLIKKPFAQISESDFDLIINTNFKAPFHLIQHLLPLFNQGAHIVNISSMGGFQGSAKFPGLSLYSASKSALASLTECLAVELEPMKISVNCLSLGSVRTDMFEKAFPGYEAQTSVDTIASWIAYFAMNGHKWMNGKILPISLSTP
ncbi:MAG: SDR family oxidoreductase [Lentimicrobiaceae bacterium]